MAPESAGTAVNQNSWLLVNRKPTLSRLTVTTLHSTQMEKEIVSEMIEIQRLRFAMRAPVFSQNSGFSGSQW